MSILLLWITTPPVCSTAKLQGHAQGEIRTPPRDHFLWTERYDGDADLQGKRQAVVTKIHEVIAAINAASDDLAVGLELINNNAAIWTALPPGVQQTD